MEDVVTVPKGSASSDVGDNSSISITSVLSKVLEKIVAGKWGHLLESNSILPPFQSSHRKEMRTCYALLTVSPTLQVAWRGAWGGKTCSVRLLNCI